MIRKMAYLEIANARTIKPAISRGMLEGARLIALGETELDLIEAELEGLKPRVTNEMVAMYKRTDKVFLPLADRAVGATEKKLDFINLLGENIKTDAGLLTSVFKASRLAYITGLAAAKVVLVTEATKMIIKDILTKGLNEGLAPADIAENIRGKNKTFSPSRALRIARTETHSAAISAQQQVIKEAKFETEKEWISAGDNYVRSIARGAKFDHIAANGERVPLDAIFVRTGEGLKHPGDPTGSAGNVINCRCIELYHTV